MWSENAFRGFIFLVMTAVRPYTMGDMFQEPSGFIKPQIAPNPIYTVFSYTDIPMVKFNLCIGHSKRLAIITIYCNKSCMNVSLKISYCPGLTLRVKA